MHSLVNKRILLGITGGIAAYKAPDLVRRLRDAGADVKVIMTRGACEFVTPLTLQAVSGHRVHTELLDVEAEAAMSHIELARWADAIVVAPATADALARFAAGRADNLLCTVLRASDAPLLLAPAMNQAMWRDPANQANCQLLVERGYHMVGPDAGAQACGDTGAGRMSEPLDIVRALAACFDSGALAGKQVLITAGPTREALDPVRYLSNHSSGKMGFALAQAALEAGAQVTLIAGPVALQADSRINRIDVESAADMLAAVQRSVGQADVFIGAAAVADFRPASSAGQKIKKTDGVDRSALELVKNPDIIASVAARAHPPLVVGFAAETNDVRSHARAKLQRKKLHMIVANDVSRSDIGFGADANEVLVLTADTEYELVKSSKSQLARKLLALIATQLKKHAAA
ncbi:MAG: bifunctional phosphopantothenoylcysteine decarboxylase/phosphopantothenate--cysteine ligase CoaBC [Pseudomonadales bacterium]|nr:bifunctional phosphopantothenoylcysteine decarboxylase/phosphopantothenate--cysteine ligase CoaBC [Pseudomonadales bacterium]